MTRTLRRLYWLIIGLALGLTIPWLFVSSAYGQQSITLGYGNQNGHSFSSRDKVNPPGYTGQSGIVVCERYKRFQKLNFLEFSYGKSVVGYHFIMRDNGNMKERDQFAVLGTVDGAVYLTYFKWVNPFVRLGFGMEAATDDLNPAVSITDGVEIKVYKNISVVVAEIHAQTLERRHSFFYGGLKFKF